MAKLNRWAPKQLYKSRSIIWHLDLLKQDCSKLDAQIWRPRSHWCFQVWTPRPRCWPCQGSDIGGWLPQYFLTYSWCWLVSSLGQLCHPQSARARPHGEVIFRPGEGKRSALGSSSRWLKLLETIYANIVNVSPKVSALRCLAVSWSWCRGKRRPLFAKIWKDWRYVWMLTRKNVEFDYILSKFRAIKVGSLGL